MGIVDVPGRRLAVFKVADGLVIGPVGSRHSNEQAQLYETCCVLAFTVASCRCRTASRLRAAPDDGRDDHANDKGDDERK